MLTAFNLEYLGEEGSFDFDMEFEEIHGTAVTASAPAIPKHVTLITVLTVLFFTISYSACHRSKTRSSKL